MAISITLSVTDDDGTGTTGTIFNNSWVQATLKAAVDTALQSLTPISPAQITSNQNNYSPTGLSTAQVLRINTDASRTITGLAAQAGRLLIVANAGSFDIVFAHQSGSSSAANRFVCPGGASFTLNAGDTIHMYYDDSSGFWRLIAF